MTCFNVYMWNKGPDRYSAHTPASQRARLGTPGTGGLSAGTCLGRDVGSSNQARLTASVEPGLAALVGDVSALFWGWNLPRYCT